MESIEEGNCPLCGPIQDSEKKHRISFAIRFSPFNKETSLQDLFSVNCIAAISHLLVFLSISISRRVYCLTLSLGLFPAWDQFSGYRNDLLGLPYVCPSKGRPSFYGCCVEPYIQFKRLYTARCLLEVTACRSYTVSPSLSIVRCDALLITCFYFLFYLDCHSGPLLLNRQHCFQ